MVPWGTLAWNDKFGNDYANLFIQIVGSSIDRCLSCHPHSKRRFNQFLKLETCFTPLALLHPSLKLLQEYPLLQDHYTFAEASTTSENFFCYSTSLKHVRKIQPMVATEPLVDDPSRLP